MDDHDYHNQQRMDVIAHIDVASDSRILDVGCGTGAMGRALIDKGCGQVFGIEFDREAAVEARRVYSQVITGDVDSVKFDFGGIRFSAIVCADILEHLRDPWRVLRRLRPLLRDDGCIVASIPNLRNVATICELLMGDFKYTDWGIQDRSHLRFFTRASILQMFADCGYSARVVGVNYDDNAQPIAELWLANRLPERLQQVLRLMVGADFTPTPEDLQEFLSIQFVVKAMPATSSRD